MDKEREAELVNILDAYKGQEILARISELLSLRRERHRDKLESEENTVVRGRAKECKDLLYILS